MQHENKLHTYTHIIQNVHPRMMKKKWAKEELQYFSSQLKWLCYSKVYFNLYPLWLSLQGFLLLQFSGHSCQAAPTQAQRQQDPHCWLGKRLLVNSGFMLVFSLLLFRIDENTHVRTQSMYVIISNGFKSPGSTTVHIILLPPSCC